MSDLQEQPSDTPTPGHPPDTPAGDSSNGVKRKRSTAGSSSARGVANLTPEQLERKRANDREAQRAIRERTKNQIENLNREIQELKSQQPYLDLQAALRQKDAVKAENEELKRRIFSFISSVQPFLTGDGPPQGLTELAVAAERNALTLQQSAAGVHPLTDSPYPPAPVPEVHSPQTSIIPSPPGSQTSLVRNAAVGPTTRSRTWTSSDPNVRNIHPDLAYNHYDKRMGVNFLLDNNPPKLTNGLAQGTTEPPSHYTALPQNIGPTCTLDAILLSFRAEHHRLFQAGAPSSQVSGPLYPNFNSLLNADTTIPSHPLSKVMIDILRTFPDISKLPEQIAVMYIMFIIMRWQIEPTRANYELLPSWATPRPSQLFTAHPHWIDYLPFPRLRDATIQQSEPVIGLDDFFIPFTTTLSLGWPYDPADVLVPRPPANLRDIVPTSPGREEQKYDMNPVFETHLRKLENWTLGPAFAEAFPQWRDCVKIRDR